MQNEHKTICCANCYWYEHYHCHAMPQSENGSLAFPYVDEFNKYKHWCGQFVTRNGVGIMDILKTVASLKRE